MPILIVYGSKEGQTAKMAGRLTNIISNRSLPASTYSGKAIGGDISADTFEAGLYAG